MIDTMLFAVAATLPAPEIRHVQDVTLGGDETDLEIQVAADGPLTVDRIHSGAGRLRVWFARSEVVDMDRPGDGKGIRLLRAYGGVRGSTVVVVRHSAGRLPGEAVQVLSDSSGARIRFARALVAPAEPEPAAQPAPARLASEVPVQGAPVAEATAPTSSPQTTTSTPAPRRPTASTADPAAPRLAETRAPLGLVSAPPPSRGGPVLWIAAILGALGLVVVARWLRRRALGKADPTSISVLSRVRLGAKHEIVVVRALGRDHLVAFGDGSVRRIASQSRAASAREGDRDADAATDREGPTDLSVPAVPPPDEDLLPRPIPLYGRSGTIGGAGFAAPPSESDAVAGIVRLRRAAGR